MKILMSAFSCCPERGSEPGVGWNWVEQISKRHEVWVLTSDEFQHELRVQSNPNLHFCFIPSFKLWHSLQNMPLPGLDWIYYYWWQWKAYRIARFLHREINFDLAHHVTFVSWRAPSFLSLLPIPFIWGPIGGGGVPPRILAGELGLRGRLSEGFRAWCQKIPLIDPTVRLTMRRASLILANIEETAALIPGKFQHKVRLMFGVGVTLPNSARPATNVEDDDSFIVLFAAQLRPIKGGTLAISAFAKLIQACPRSQLIIVGDGPERRRLQLLTQELGISEKVHFLGWIPHEDVLSWMRKCHVLLHPSLRDSGGMVLLEAMAESKPVVCLDVSGPGHIVTSECGFKVPPGESEQCATEISIALSRIGTDIRLREALGQAGQARLKQLFDWKRRGDQMLAYYSEVTSAAPIKTHSPDAVRGG